MSFRQSSTFNAHKRRYNHNSETKIGWDKPLLQKNKKSKKFGLKYSAANKGIKPQYSKLGT